MVKIPGNEAVEDAAVAYVLDRERSAGRHPRDVRYQGAAGDVENPSRLIEVKPFSRSWGSLNGSSPARFKRHDNTPTSTSTWSSTSARATRSSSRSRCSAGSGCSGLLAGVKESHSFEMPWPVADFDTTPSEVSAAMAIHAATQSMSQDPVTECR